HRARELGHRVHHRLILLEALEASDVRRGIRAGQGDGEEHDRGGLRRRRHPDRVECDATRRSITADRCGYFPAKGRNPRVAKSHIVSTTRIASQKNPASAASQRTPWASLMCMKNRTTSVAFTPAMMNAIGVLNGPRSTYDTRIVSAVRKSSAASTAP